MKKFTRIAVAAAIAGLAFAAQANLLIDDFSTNQTFLIDNTDTGGGLSNTQSGAGIIGGWRDLYVEKTFNTSTNKNATIGVDQGALSFSTSSSTNGYGIVRWDGAHFDNFSTIDATGLGGLNFAAGALGFDIVVSAADLNFPFTLNVYTDATNWTSLTLLSGGPGGYFIPFSAFQEAIAVQHGTGVDFSNIGALEAIINTGGASQAVDLEIQLAQTVPEPESLALVGLGLLGLVAASRRKSVKS